MSFPFICFLKVFLYPIIILYLFLPKCGLNFWNFCNPNLKKYKASFFLKDKYAYSDIMNNNKYG